MSIQMRFLFCIFLVLPQFLFSQTSISLHKNEEPVDSQVLRLVDEAYGFYQNSNDVECEKTVEKIVELDPKNREAYTLRANMAMFKMEYKAMMNNLNQLYEFYPNEPEIYAKFAVSHLNYSFFSDSMKQLLCRRSIRLGDKYADGYVNLGMVAMARGNYQDALQCFDVGLNKQWKDSLNKVYLNLFYARSLYGIGDTIGAIKKLDELVPRISGNDKYTSIFLRVSYKLGIGRTDVKVDLDTLNSFAPDQPDVWLLSAKYYNLIGQKDSACKIAKKIKMNVGSMGFDLTDYCNDLKRDVNLKQYKHFIYSENDHTLDLNIESVHTKKGIKLKWSKDMKESAQNGSIHILASTLDSCLKQSYKLTHNAETTLKVRNAFWLAKRQVQQLRTVKYTNLSFEGEKMSKYLEIGHDQIEVLNENNDDVFYDCVVISNGTIKISFIDNPENPLILSIESESYTLRLTKIE
jgi:tetratricopeptide (TPR) repeat protein